VTAKTEVSEIPGLCGKKGALIILGNEETGISQMVKENCDYLILIPFGGSEQNIESLNVAQAASIVLYECRNLGVK
jgi:TrmH RNA methyltransferase